MHFMGTAVVVGSSRNFSYTISRFIAVAAILLSAMLVANRSAYGKSRITFPYSPCTERSTLPGCVIKRLGTELQPYTPKRYPDQGLVDTMTEQGRHARGFYITPMYLRGLGPVRTAAAMKRGNLDAVVIDMKDDLGLLTYPSKIPLAQKQINVLIKDPSAMVKAFHEQGMYVIARIVSFKDSRLPYVRPDLAVRIGAHAERLYAVGENWLDAYSPEVQDYLIDIALELKSFGFDEIQFDYMRFPRGYPSSHATWLHAGDTTRSHADVIAGFLERVDRALTLPISADVFGLTTLVDGDPRGLGQYIERMAKFIEAISPMMYANGMDTYFRGSHITSHVIDLIQCGLQRGRHKAQDIVLRPYLQGYSNGVEHMWGPDFVAEQVLAAQRAGSDGFLFWNPTMRNEVTMNGLRGLAAKKPGNAVALLQHRPEQIKAPWCPQSGNVFGSAAERDKRDKNATPVRAARVESPRKKPSVLCAGGCAASP
jgi:hypothetical protein